MALQMQAPSLTRAPAGSPARLRSAFCAPPPLVRVRVPAPGRARSTAAARITMRFGRVETKQAYICRDCGYIYKDKTRSIHCHGLPAAAEQMCGQVLRA